eukprot:m.205726 g.205726  ORF g.205726 m.205726 type:complete len:872 (+) comp17099_c0_seq2:87-2702(+)
MSDVTQDVLVTDESATLEEEVPYQARRGRHEDLLRILQVPQRVAIPDLVNSRPVTGVVARCMESFGFLASPEHDGNLFFHFRAADCPGRDIYEGACFEYEVEMDRRKGKPIAVRMVRLNDDALTAEMTHQNVLVGVIEEGQSNSRGRGGGKVKFELEGYLFKIPYFPDGVQGDTPLEGDDEVQFNIAYSANTGRFKAKQIVFQRRPEVPRYQGIVIAVKDSGFGFIAAVEGGEQLFFHMSQFTGQTTDDMPHLNDEVDYKLTMSKGKPTAVNVRLLPQGTIDLYERDLEDRLAIVTACQGRLDPNRHTVVSKAGRVCLCQADQTALGQPLSPELAFNFGQFTATLDANPDDAPWWDQPVTVGDVVHCRVGRNRMSGNLMAVGVRRTATEDPEVLAMSQRAHSARYTGVVQAVTFADKYERRNRSPRGAGRADIPATAIKVTGRQLPTGVELSNIPDAGQVVVHSESGRMSTIPRLFPGDKVTFLLEKDVHSRGSPRVDQLRLETPVDDSKDRLMGKVSSLKDKFGFVETSNARQERFFHYSELSGLDAEALHVGMWLSYLSAKEAGDKLVACRLQEVNNEDLNVAEVMEPGTYHGRVTKLVGGTPNYPRGQLRVVSIPADVVIPQVPTVVFAELEGQGLDGEQVEKATPTAVDSSTASAATVGEEAAASKAVVSVESASEQFADAEESTTSASTTVVKVNTNVPFGVGTMINPDERLRVGDHVQFRVVICEHNLPKAVALKRLEQPEVNMAGTVIAIRADHGILLSEKYKKLKFSLNVIEETARLGPKDEVEFDVGINDQTGRPHATRVKLIQRHVPTERPASLKRFGKAANSSNAQTSTQPPSIIRQPSLPNVALGFGAGRGRPLEESPA